MKIGSEYDIELVFLRHYRYLALEKMLKEMSEKIIVVMQQEYKEMQDQNISHPIVKKIISYVEKNIEKASGRFAAKK